MNDLLPISIALVGAPDSGKQAVQEAYSELTKDWYVEQGKGILKVISNPGNDIVRDLDTAVGMFGGWKEDFRVFFRRYEQEQRLQKDNESYVTLGTALENLAHTGVNMENIMQGIQTDEQQQQLQVQQVTMTQLTYLFLTTFRYSFAFRLPRPSGIVLPDSNNTESNYNRRIDDALTMVLGNFGIRMQEVRGTPDEQAATIHQVISDYVLKGPVETEAIEVDVQVPSDEPATLSE